MLEAERLWQATEAGLAVLAELDERRVLERVLEAARLLTGARYAAVVMVDRQQQELTSFLASGVEEPVRASIGRLPRGRGVLGALIEDPRPLRLKEIAAHPASGGFPPGHPVMQSFLGVPIMVGGRAWGNIYLSGKDAGGFEQSDEDAIVLLAGWAAIAIERARLQGAAERRCTEVERTVRIMRETQEIAIDLGGEPDRERMLELVAKRGRALVQARCLVVLLADGDRLLPVAGAGEMSTPAGDPIAIEGTLAGEVLRSGRARRVEDLRAHRTAAERCLSAHGARSAMLVPMAFRAMAVGLLIAYDHRSGEPFGDQQEQALRSLAAAAARALANAKTAAAERLRATLGAAEQERRRWARELHDQTLQSLGALRLKLATARRAGDLAAWQRAGDAAIGQLEQEIGNLRAIIADLRPPALDEIGLEAALAALAEHHQRSDGLIVHLTLSPAEPLFAEELQIAIYRVVQEALSNVVRHARARQAQITITADSDRVTVQVSDDGIGFDPRQPAEGFGLVGIRERVLLLGGALRVKSGSRGTLLQAAIPLMQTPTLTRSI